MAKLRIKQIRFAQEYIYDWNATQAAIRAGYSKKTAGSIGHELLKKPEIQEEIERQKNSIEQLAEVSKLMAVKNLKEIAFGKGIEEREKRGALQDLAKLLGWNNPERVINTNINHESKPLTPKEAQEINDQLEEDY